jgi:hypothetical protein
MSAEELDRLERESFLEWRRGLAECVTRFITFFLLFGDNFLLIFIRIF